MIADTSTSFSLAAWMIVIFWIVVMWVFPIWICVTRGAQRNRNGWVWGLLLGWLGVLMIFLLPPRDKSEAVERSQYKEFHDEVFKGDR